MLLSNKPVIVVVSSVSKDMLMLTDTQKTMKRRRPDKEKEDLQREIIRQEDDAKAIAYQGFQSEIKSHYMYNVPLIPKVVCSCASMIICFIVIVQ